MTDKVQKIREEVVGIINSINLFTPDEDGKNSSYEAGKLDVASKILQVIDSMQEEPQVKESAKIQQVNETCKENGDSLTQENDWDAEFRKKADSYADNTFIEGVSDEGFYADNRNAIWNAVYYGAMLQKEHDKEIKKEMPVSEDLDTLVEEEWLFNEKIEVDCLESIPLTKSDLSALVHKIANWQKEQLMAKAVNVTIAIPYQNGYGGYTQLVDSKEGLPFGENLKVLVIKED